MRNLLLLLAGNHFTALTTCLLLYGSSLAVGTGNLQGCFKALLYFVFFNINALLQWTKITIQYICALKALTLATNYVC